MPHMIALDDDCRDLLLDLEHTSETVIFTTYADLNVSISGNDLTPEALDSIACYENTPVLTTDGEPAILVFR